MTGNPVARESSHTRHVVITGASSGIGAELAEAYAKEGARLTLFGRHAERLERTAAQCRAHGAEAHMIVADVTNEEEMRDRLLAADAAHPIDILIANAGVGGGDAVAGDHGEAASFAAHVMRTNVLGVTHTVAPLVRRFVTRRRGHIVIMSSLAGLLALPDTPVYSASKAAVRTYGHALRRLVAKSGVKVTVVCPAIVETPMSASVPFRIPFHWTAERAAARIVSGIARGRREIAFPLPIVLAIGFAGYLPMGLADIVLGLIRGSTLGKR
jgi:short-subunit dehydrogenase